MSELSPTLQKYVDFIAAAGRPVSFAEIVEVTPGYNGMRHLKRRGLIHNVIKDYRNPGEPVTPQARVPMYVLTTAGDALASPASRRMGIAKASLPWIQSQQARAESPLDEEAAACREIHRAVIQHLAVYQGDVMLTLRRVIHAMYCMATARGIAATQIAATIQECLQIHATTIEQQRVTGTDSAGAT